MAWAWTTAPFNFSSYIHKVRYQMNERTCVCVAMDCKNRSKIDDGLYIFLASQFGVLVCFKLVEVETDHYAQRFTIRLLFLLLSANGMANVCDFAILRLCDFTSECVCLFRVCRMIWKALPSSNKYLTSMESNRSNITLSNCNQHSC